MSRFERHTPTRAFKALLLGSAVALALPAQAAVSNPGLEQTAGQRVVDSIPLSLAGQSLDEARLDWRTPSHRFTLELPPSDWVEDITLTLYADPVLPVDPARRSGRDIEVRLNGGKPVPVRLNRKGFTAHIPLPTSDVRPGRNMLDVVLKPAPGVGCLAETDGGWDIHLDRSHFDTVARAKSRSVFVSEVRTLLARPSTTPRRISLRAYGGDSDTLEALIAQGVSLRTPYVPRFTLGTGGYLHVMAGTRVALAGILTDKAVLEGSGPRIAVHKGRPLRLVITGDSEGEVRDAVNTFATYDLPDARRRIVSPTSLKFAGPLARTDRKIGRRTRIADLGGMDFSRNWGAGPDAVSFDVSDPRAADARVSLELKRADFVAPDSVVDVELNGRSLGRATLDTDTVKVEYAVPQGWLQGSDNSLKIIPDLHPVADGCAPDIAASGLVVGSKSRVELRTPAPTHPYDLSRFAAGGSLIADKSGQGTHVILPEGRSQREDALRILGRLAVAEGAGLTAATYGNASRAGVDHIVFTKPPADLDAPRSVHAALAEPTRGSVAGLYPNGSKWVAVLAPQAAGSLGATANALTGRAWHDMAGGISRIRDDRVEVAHTAFAPELLPNTPSVNLAFDGLEVDALRLPTAEDMTQVAKAVTIEVERSAETLAAGWSRIELPLLSDLADDLTLRGTHDAPRAVSRPMTLQQARLGLSAGFGLDRLDAKLARMAAKARRKAGVQAVDVDTTWGWGDRNLSFAALLVMMVFAWSAATLANSENSTSGRR